MKISSWNLDWAVNQDRITRLQEIEGTYGSLRWDGRDGGDVRLMLAGCTFHGGPGREDEAALAWANELKFYFKRGIGEQPVVTYDASIGVYIVTGLMQTTHPGDRPDKDGIAWFT